MKYFTFLLLSFLALPLASQNSTMIAWTEKPKPAPLPPEEIHSKFDEMPEFPGGPNEMQKYLEDHISLPAVMRGICSARKLIVGFVVEKDGGLSKICIVQSIEGCPDFDFEVLRVVKNMPKWNPGKINGRWVRCYYKMPVYID